MVIFHSYVKLPEGNVDFCRKDQLIRLVEGGYIHHLDRSLSLVWGGTGRLLKPGLTLLIWLGIIDYAYYGPQMDMHLGRRYRCVKQTDDKWSSKWLTPKDGWLSPENGYCYPIHWACTNRPWATSQAIVPTAVAPLNFKLFRKNGGEAGFVQKKTCHWPTSKSRWWV